MFYSVNEGNFPKTLAIGNIVYICTFFKEINRNESFHIQENNQHDLLYCSLRPESFLYQRACVFLLNGLFST